MASGPVQPMWNAAQNNLRGMRGEISSWNPDFPPWLCDQSVNNRLRAVIDRRIWAGLLVKDQLNIPAAYTTGTVTTTTNSNLVAGQSTSFPTNDLVNTTLGGNTDDVGILTDVTPVSMAGIALGDWLTIAGGTGAEDQALVSSITDRTFRTKLSHTHTAGATVWKSSLTRQQLQVVQTAPWYTVIGVSSGTQLVIDQTWGGPGVTASSYSIFKAYVTFGDNCRFVHEVANLNRRYRLGLHMPQGAINAYDPQRSATESTYLLVDYVPDEVGRAQYELYPRPTSAQVFATLYYRIVSPLSDDEDTPPPFIRSDVLVMGAIADSLRFRPKANKYYDQQTALTIANQKEAQFEREIAQMERADDSVYMQNLQWKYSMWPLGSYGSDFLQSHDIGIMTGDI